MKPRCSSLFTTIIFAVTMNSFAQAPATPLAGFVFANAITSNQSADVTANGKKLTRKGLNSGTATSGLGLPVGSYQLQISVPNMTPAAATIPINVGTTPIIVAYREQSIDPTTRRAKEAVKLLQLPALPQKEKYIISTINVEPKEAFAAAASGQSQTLQFGKPGVFETKSIKISDAKGTSETVEVDERASYYCFVFRKADGKIGTVLVPQMIYTW
jgi:hypothetical protein